jgi:hypothetical protein
VGTWGQAADVAATRPDDPPADDPFVLTDAPFDVEPFEGDPFDDEPLADPSLLEEAGLADALSPDPVAAATFLPESRESVR